MMLWKSKSLLRATGIASPGFASKRKSKGLIPPGIVASNPEAEPPGRHCFEIGVFRKTRLCRFGLSDEWSSQKWRPWS